MPLLSPKDAASALGVSESSLKRWCDQGLLGMVKTAGGHRRIEAATIVDYARRSGREIVMPQLLGLERRGKRQAYDPNSAATAFLAALLEGDEKGTRFLAAESLAAGISIAEFGDRLVAPAFHEIGNRWACGATEIYEERLACQLCHATLESLALLLPKPHAKAPLAIGATVENDHYTLATRLVSLVLRQNGWRTQSLGSNLPWPTLLAAVHDLKPRIFWLSSSSIPDQAAFIARYREFFAAVGTQTAVVVGGQAWTPDLRAQLPYAAYCDYLHHLETFAATLFRPRKSRTATP